MKLVRIFILLVVLILCIGISFSFANEDKVDIKKETCRYKKSFIKIREDKTISTELKDYMSYINDSVDILNKELWNDKQLYKKIEENGIFENGKVDLKNNKDKAVEKYDRYLKDNGIKIGYSEGDIFLYIDPIYIYTNFKDVLPEEIIEFFKINAGDIKEGFTEDGALIIPWDSLRNKIVKYENYLNIISSINCPYIQELTKQKIQLYLNAYMNGLPNTRIYEYVDEAKHSYDKFLFENRSSKFYNIIKSYYSDLMKNNFKFVQKESIKDGFYGMVIIDKNNKEVFIDDVVEQYLKRVQSIMDNY